MSGDPGRGERLEDDGVVGEVREEGFVQSLRR